MSTRELERVEVMRRIAKGGLQLVDAAASARSAIRRSQGFTTLRQRSGIGNTVRRAGGSSLEPKCAAARHERSNLRQDGSPL
jgi:hypothetical protein